MTGRRTLPVVVLLALVTGRVAAQSDTDKAEAARLAGLGNALLSSAKDGPGARAACEAALRLEPTNTAAVGCLQVVVAAEQTAQAAAAAARVAQAVANARTRELIAEANATARLGQADKRLAALAAAAAQPGRTPADLDAIRRQLDGLKAEPALKPSDELVKRARDSWVFDLGFALLFITAVSVILQVVRSLRRRSRAHAWLGRIRGYPKGWTRSRWLIHALEDESKLGVTELLMDAMARFKRTMREPLEVPTLLPLTPVAGSARQPQVWKDFRIAPPRTVTEIENDIAIKIDEHAIELSSALSDLQLKVGPVDISNLAKVAGNLKRWFDVGVPSVSGIVVHTPAAAGAASAVMVRVTRSGDGHAPATIISSTDHADPLEAARLAADRTAYKLLYLFASPDCSSVDVDGLAARRQGLMLLQRWVVVGVCDERKAGLEKAVVNLKFARDAVHIGRLGDAAGDDIDQRDGRLCELYLYESVAHALLHEHAGTQPPASQAAATAVDHRTEAIELLQSILELADPADPAQGVIRLQALFNNAVLEQRLGTRESIERALELYQRLFIEARLLPMGDVARNAMLLLGRFGHVTAAASYPLSAWHSVEHARADTWLAAAEGLRVEVNDPGSHGGRIGAQVSDAIVMHTNMAYACLVLLYAQEVLRLPLPNLTQPDPKPGRFEVMLRTAAQSLSIVASRQPTTVTFERMVLLALLLAEPALARAYARQGLAVGSNSSEVLAYGAAWAAMQAGGSGNVLEAAAICRNFPAPKTWPDFIALSNHLLQTPLGPSSPNYFVP